MNKDKVVKFIVAILIIVGSVLSLGVKFWADDAALNVDRPKFVKNGPLENFSLLIGNTVYVIDADKQTKQRVDLNDYGISAFGDYDYFSNGDVLLYNREIEPTLFESIARFLRIKETGQEKPADQDGMYRCSYRINNCQFFTTALPAFHSTFRIFIDRSNDDVYVADTTRFALYKLNGQGELLAKSTDGLHFPNQIYKHSNRLYVANTNLHSIKTVSTDTEFFGDEIANHKIKLSKSHTWPTELIRVGQHWWVGVSRGSMNESRLQIYDENWSKTVTPEVEEDAEASVMAMFRDEILVSDWINLKVYRYDLSGKRLPDLSNVDIDKAFSVSREAIEYYEKIAFYALIAFGIVFLSGSIAAFLLEKDEIITPLAKQPEYTKPENIENLESPSGSDVYWIETRHRKRLWLYFLAMVVLLVPYGLSVLSIMLDVEKFSWISLISLTSFFPFFGVIFWAWYRICLFKIGISDKLLLIDDGHGRVVSAKPDRVKYSKAVLIVEDVVVFFGQPNKRLFPEDELEKWVIPRMLLGEEISVWAVQKLMWKQGYPGVIAMLTIVIVTLLVYILASVS